MSRHVMYAACMLAVMLTGCSKPPTLNDVAPSVRKYWAPCTMVKLADIRQIATTKVGWAKYKMEYTYTLEVVHSPVDLVGGSAACPVSNLELLQALGHVDLQDMKPGMVITATLEQTF